MAGAFQTNAFQNNAFQVDEGVQTYNAHAQAQARIISFGVVQTGQAQAQIKQVYYGHGQALAYINHFAWAQTQAQIKQTYQQYAQANALIPQGMRIVQSVDGIFLHPNQVNPVFSSSTTAGNIVLVLMFSRGLINHTAPSSSPSWNEINAPYADSGAASASPNAGSIEAFWRYTLGGETNLGNFGTGGSTYAAAFEISGGVLYDTDVGDNEASATHLTRTLSSPTAKPVIMFGVFMGTAGSGGNQPTYTPDTGYTEFSEANPEAGTRGEIIYRIDDNSSSSYTIGTNINFTSIWGAITLLFTVTNNYGHGQAQASIFSASYGHGQAQATILQTYRQYAQAQGMVTYPRQASGQAEGYIRGSYFLPGQANAHITNALARAYGQANALIYHSKGYGQANALIDSAIKQKMGQAQALIVDAKVHAQAQAFIDINIKPGQANALIRRLNIVKMSQAQADIKNVDRAYGQAQAVIVGRRQYGQAQGLIKTTNRAYGQAQAQIGHLSMGQAQAYIDSVHYIVKFNNYLLPGYAQSESFISSMRTGAASPVYYDGGFTEQIGLENKLIALKMMVTQPVYSQNKILLMKAGSMLRSSNTWSKLYIQNPDRYYLAITKSLKMSQEAVRTHLEYDIEWEAKPWLYSDAIYTASGTGTITVDRSLLDGGWTPLAVTVTGTDVTLSGYTAAGDFAGFISISGAVTNFEVTSDPFTSSNPRAMNYTDYSLFLGPGTTYIETTGATDCVVTWQNRWNL